VLHISHTTFSASPLPIKAVLTGARHCSAAGFAVNAYAPVLALARKLLAAFAPEQVIEVYRGDTLCFRVVLGTAAKLTVEDDRNGRPRFRKYKARQSWEAAAPIAPKTPLGITEPSASIRATTAESAAAEIATTTTTTTTTTTPMPALSATKPVPSSTG